MLGGHPDGSIDFWGIHVPDPVFSSSSCLFYLFNSCSKSVIYIAFAFLVCFFFFFVCVCVVLGGGCLFVCLFVSRQSFYV